MRKFEKGFTVIEIVVAVALLAIVGVPLARIFLSSFKFQGMSHLKTEVNEVAQLVAERLKAGTLDVMEVELENESVSIPTQVEFTSDDLNTSRFAQKYNIVIKDISVEKGAGEPSKTPDPDANEYDYTLTLTGDRTIQVPDNSEKIYYDGSELKIVDLDLDKEYNLLIINDTGIVQDIIVRKETEAKVTIYTKGSDYVNITQRRSGLTKDQNMISMQYLGNASQRVNTQQYLYNVTIVVTSTQDESITTTMNTTFSREVEAKNSNEI